MGEVRNWQFQKFHYKSSGSVTETWLILLGTLLEMSWNWGQCLIKYFAEERRSFRTHWSTFSEQEITFINERLEASEHTVEKSADRCDWVTVLKINVYSLNGEINIETIVLNKFEATVCICELLKHLDEIQIRQRIALLQSLIFCLIQHSEQVSCLKKTSKWFHSYAFACMVTAASKLHT
jgi:hypothetical protein